MKSSAATFALLLLLGTASAEAQNRNIGLTVFGSQVDMQGETDFGDGFVSEFDDGTGFGAAANFPLGRFFSIEAAVFSVRADTGLVFEGDAAVDLGTMNLTPVSLGVQFHPLAQSRFDPYVGAGVAYVLGDDLTSADLDAGGIGRIEVESAAGYVINAGIAFQITDGFGIVIDGRQVQYEPSTRSSVTGVERDLEVTPRILSAGLRLRF
jgi:outer membrane protein W